MPTIRVEEDVFQGLKAIAEPFVDTPNSVIRRLLEGRGVLAQAQTNTATSSIENVISPSSEKSNSNIHRKSLTPQSTYEQYLLYVLGKNFKGRGGKHEVTKEVITLMKSNGYINAADLEIVSTGESKAENTIAWGRNALKEQGLIRRDSPRGIWELSSAGVDKSNLIRLPINED